MKPRLSILPSLVLGLSFVLPAPATGQDLEDLKDEVLEEVASPELQKLSQEIV